MQAAKCMLIPHAVIKKHDLISYMTHNNAKRAQCLDLLIPANVVQLCGDRRSFKSVYFDAKPELIIIYHQQQKLSRRGHLPRPSYVIALL